ncbi:hypothetical protein K501DRAFT_329466 [Backusella circina FSU 941]|nr:hypothetical protein K501DRAFT_329466 [Backusella circina FSU 941]
MTQGYAYEIRFVDNDKVQVFDLARRHIDPTSATLPTEYKAEEVLRGDLRYSKLLGTEQTATEEQWEHVTYTKRGRRSIQRHTFMMGSNSAEHDTIMDLEVGNKDMADIRFNENNVYQNNNNNNSHNISITNENSASFSSQPTSFDSSVMEAIENSPDHNQSKHFEFEEADLTNLIKKPSSTVHKNTKKSVSSQTRDDNITADSNLNSNTQNNSMKGRNQHQSIESDYFIDKQHEKMVPPFPSNNREDSIDTHNNNQNGKRDLKQHSFGYGNDRKLTESSTQYKNDKVVNDSETFEQTQYLNHQATYQNEQYYDIQHTQQYQMDQAHSKLDSGKSSNSQHTYITAPDTVVMSNKKNTYYSNNMTMTNDVGNTNLTRIKSVPLENYEVSPERSCCIIS